MAWRKALCYACKPFMKYHAVFGANLFKRRLKCVKAYSSCENENTFTHLHVKPVFPFFPGTQNKFNRILMLLFSIQWKSMMTRCAAGSSICLFNIYFFWVEIHQCNVTVMYAIKVPREWCKSSRLAHFAQLLKSQWQQRHKLCIYSDTLDSTNAHKFMFLQQ